MPLIDQWQGFTGLPDFSDPPAIPTDLKALFDFLGERAIPRYASPAARDAELPSPADGMVCWVGSPAALQVRHDGGWQTVWAPSNWVTLTLRSGWTYIEEPPAARREGNYVSLSGEILDNGNPQGSANPIFQLPADMRPGRRIRFPYGWQSPMGYLTVESTGQVWVNGPSRTGSPGNFLGQVTFSLRGA